MANQRPLPQDTNLILQHHLGACRNLSLLLDKFNPWRQQPDGGWQLSFLVEVQRRGQWEQKSTSEGEARRLWLGSGRDNQTRLVDRPLAPNTRTDGQLLAANYRRWQQGCNDLSAQIFELTSAARLVVGLGAESVLETSLALHRIHGYPVIPGSALKGLARTVAFFELAQLLGLVPLSFEERKQRKEQQPPEQTPLEKLATILESNPADVSTKRNWLALQTDSAVAAEAKIKGMLFQDLTQMEHFTNFRTVFGVLEQAGTVIFLDAMPKEKPLLVVDVMNPHYPDYYRDESGRTAPSDDQSPNPVAFLAVETDSIFGFALAPRHRNRETDLRAVGVARRWLEIGLREVGIGAKTAAGYGVFD
ncbi:MAG: type III-B CRISPR module RAMP protein Cmr6 [Caldilineaceae bacterium]